MPEKQTDGISLTWKMGGGLLVMLPIAWLLAQEFVVPGNETWNVFLILFLSAACAVAVWGTRYFHEHADEIGEARFDTSNDSRNTGSGENGE